MNPPAVIGRSASAKIWAWEAATRVIIAPKNENKAVKKLKVIAFLGESPAWMNMPKFPISCGISWRTIARVVVNPSGMLMK